MSSFVNAKTAHNKLQFGPDKCFVIHIGKKHETYKHIDLYVDSWKMNEVDSIHTIRKQNDETYDGEHEMNVTDVGKYL